MAVEPIRNPVEWSWDQLKHTGTALASAGRALRAHEAPPRVRRIEVADLKDVLRRGLDDFGAYRSDVIFLCIIYPIRSEEHTSELQSRGHLVCRLLLEK